MTAGATTLNGASTIRDLSIGFTSAERTMVAKKILEKCGALDSVADGLVQDTVACQKAFSIATDVAMANGARDGSCPTAAQKIVIADSLAVFRLIARSWTIENGRFAKSRV